MTPLWWAGDLAPGDVGARVLVVQKMLLCYPTGCMDGATVAAVRGFQRGVGLDPHGWVDEATARALGSPPSDADLPAWYSGAPLGPGDALYEQVAAPFGGEAGVRRFQGNNRLAATGIVDEDTARLMAAARVDVENVPRRREGVTTDG